MFPGQPKGILVSWIAQKVLSKQEKTRSYISFIGHWLELFQLSSLLCVAVCLGSKFLFTFCVHINNDINVNKLRTLSRQGIIKRAITQCLHLHGFVTAVPAAPLYLHIMVYKQSNPLQHSIAQNEIDDIQTPF